MSVNIVTIEEFKEEIKMYIPIHEVASLPRIGDVEGKSFECGCGNSHIMNFEEHYFIADGGVFKAVFLSPECGYLNTLKLKKMFSKNIENLYSTKFLANKPNYGFDSYPDIGAAINYYLKR